MDYNTDWYPGCTNDPDWQDRGSNYDNSERIYDRVSDTLEKSAYDVFEIALDYSDEQKIAETFKAMVIAYDNSLGAKSKENREQSQKDFVVFAKSFARVCLDGLYNEAEQND